MYKIILTFFLLFSFAFVNAQTASDYKAKAKKGDAEAQVKLGDCYFNGNGGVEKDFSEALKWYRKAAKQNNAEAQTNIGYCYAGGHGVEKSLEEAFKWYQMAAEQGHAVAQFNVGMYYYYGKGIPQNFTESFKWYRKAAEQGIAEAQNSLGVQYHNGEGVTKNYTEAARWFSESAKQGNEYAKNNLVLCYPKGYDIENDKSPQTVDWYRKAREEEDAESMYRLGMAYIFGKFVEKNPQEGFQWTYKSAEKGNTDAMLQLSTCYGSGIGVGQNMNASMEWNRKAAELGNVKAQYFLGYEYVLSNNYSAGAKWYQMAADKNDPDAQYGLAELYYKGKGVEKNRKKAIELYRKSAEQGNNDAKKFIEKFDEIQKVISNPDASSSNMALTGAWIADARDLVNEAMDGVDEATLAMEFNKTNVKLRYNVKKTFMSSGITLWTEIEMVANGTFVKSGNNLKISLNGRPNVKLLKCVGRYADMVRSAMESEFQQTDYTPAFKEILNSHLIVKHTKENLTIADDDFNVIEFTPTSVTNSKKTSADTNTNRNVSGNASNARRSSNAATTSGSRYQRKGGMIVY